MLVFSVCLLKHEMEGEPELPALWIPGVCSASGEQLTAKRRCSDKRPCLFLSDSQKQQPVRWARIYEMLAELPSPCFISSVVVHNDHIHHGERVHSTSLFSPFMPISLFSTFASILFPFSPSVHFFSSFDPLPISCSLLIWKCFPYFLISIFYLFFMFHTHK